MIGKKTLAEIRNSLGEAFRQADIDPAESIARVLEKLDLKSPPSPKEIETLELVRNGLRLQKASAKRSRRKTRTTQ